MEDYEKMALVKGDRVITLCKYEVGNRKGGTTNAVVEAKSIDGELIGIVKFILSGNCYLTKIEVFSDEYINSGVGSLLIGEVEEIARQKGCKTVGGRFKPEGKFASYSKNFYLRNGYAFSGEKNFIMLEKKLKPNSPLENSESSNKNGDLSVSQNGE